MGLLKQLGVNCFWFALWAIIPTVALYPLALWAITRTHFSADAIGETYCIAVALLFFPTGFLVDYIYRRFIRDRRGENPAEIDKTAR